LVTLGASTLVQAPGGMTTADWMSAEDDLVAAFAKHLNVLGVIGADLDFTDVGVFEVLRARSDLRKRLCADDLSADADRGGRA
jgi:hypothetical protein